MNSTLKNIRERFSCRDFTDQMPTDEQLEAITQAAIQSPSGMNLQSWQVIAITNKELIADMEKEGIRILKNENEAMYQRIMSRNGTLFYHAPCMIVFPVKIGNPPGSELIDLGIIAQTAVLAATSLDLASLHCGLVGYCFAGEKADEFKKRLAFPDGYECGMAVLLGHAKKQGAPHVPDQSKITYIK